jgi:DNA anti-recombination protein RmuC
VGAYATLSQAVASAFSGAETGAEESAELFEEFADKAPDEIEDDIRVIAEAYAAYVQELASLNLQAGETPSAEQIQQLTEASEKLNTPEIQAASDNFNEWATTNCPG